MLHLKSPRVVGEVTGLTMGCFLYQILMSFCDKNQISLQCNFVIIFFFHALIQFDNKLSVLFFSSSPCLIMHIVEVRPQKPPSPLRPILRGGNTGGGSKDWMESGQKILILFLSRLFGMAEL